MIVIWGENENGDTRWSVENSAKRFKEMQKVQTQTRILTLATSIRTHGLWNLHRFVPSPSLVLPLLEISCADDRFEDED